MSSIVLLVEGLTEVAIKPVLKTFLDRRCEEAGRPKVRLESREMSSRMLREKDLRNLVRMNLESDGVLGVVALSDVVVAGKHFDDAAAAIAFLRKAAGTKDPRYRAHAAQHDLEAWLLP